MMKFMLVLASVICIIAGASKTTYNFKTVDGLNLLANVYTPSSSLYEKYPVVFTAHGGGYVVGSKDTGYTEQQINEVLSRGWVGVSIDYRLAPGALIDEIMEDVQDAYTWVRNELVKNVTIDPDNIAIFGDSAGGGIAAMSGYKLNPRPKVILSFCPYCTNFTDPYAYNPNSTLPDSFVALTESLRTPVCEYITFNGSDPRFVFFNNGLSLQKAGWALATDNPNEPTDQVLAKLKEFSAVHNVDDKYPPTYVAHGLVDQTVPYSQSVQLAAQLELRNISYKLDLVPDGMHSFDLLPIFWQQHVLPAFDFAEQYLGPRPSASTTIYI